uniref:tetraacyldisaccharide 4'-kinase n=1 Tax=Halomonas sp. TaxID=1486246 RepID=UPI002628DA71|nr:tetraacyldisaccharide 4'-kinase [Halomonas sp.]
MGLAERWLNAAYQGAPWLGLLRPLEVLYRREVLRRARAYREGRRSRWRAPVPVIVVGNLTLGGTGKSPLVAWMGQHLATQGFHPGILSRGYGGKGLGGKGRGGKGQGGKDQNGQGQSGGGAYPLWLEQDTPVEECGDEPRMLHDQTGLPVVVDPDRPRGARRLMEGGCDLIITDDGLQHLPLDRDLEIVVVDGRRGFGNGRCLPAGPLREPLERLDSIDALVINGEAHHAFPEGAYAMRLEPARWRKVRRDAASAVETASLTPFPFSTPVKAVAGIGNPERFFRTLETLGVAHDPSPFSDHHRFRADDLVTKPGQALIMTAKDAVKCRDIAPSDSWALDVEAVPSASFVDWLDKHTAPWLGRRVSCTEETR